MSKTKTQRRPPPKKEYLVTVTVEATGTQIFCVWAVDAEFAKTLVGDGHGTLVEESFDVQSFKIDQAKAEEIV